MWLPTGYKKGIPRVSQIVSFKFPFEWRWKQWYLDWLDRNNISEKEYLSTAQDWGTFVHHTLEMYMLWIDIEQDKELEELHSNEIRYWKEYIDQLKKEFPWAKWIPEAVIRDKRDRFQWTVDLVRINWNKVFLYDYKTFEIVKKKYWMKTRLKKDWTVLKPTDKLKKVSLQMSLYAQYYIQQWYEIGWIYLVWVHDSGCYEFRGDLRDTDSIDSLLLSFFTRDKKLPPNLSIKLNNMEVRINTPIPDIAYSNAEIVIQENDFEWKTFEEKIVEWIKLQKYLLNKYKNT